MWTSPLMKTTRSEFCLLISTERPKTSRENALISWKVSNRYLENSQYMIIRNNVLQRNGNYLDGGTGVASIENWRCETESNWSEEQDRGRRR